MKYFVLKSVISGNGGIKYVCTLSSIITFLSNIYEKSYEANLEKVFRIEITSSEFGSLLEIERTLQKEMLHILDASTSS